MMQDQPKAPPPKIVAPMEKRYSRQFRKDIFETVSGIPNPDGTLKVTLTHEQKHENIAINFPNLAKTSYREIARARRLDDDAAMDDAIKANNSTTTTAAERDPGELGIPSHGLEPHGYTLIFHGLSMIFHGLLVDHPW